MLCVVCLVCLVCLCVLCVVCVVCVVCCVCVCYVLCVVGVYVLCMLSVCMRCVCCVCCVLCVLCVLCVVFCVCFVCYGLLSSLLLYLMEFYMAYQQEARSELLPSVTLNQYVPSHSPSPATRIWAFYKQASSRRALAVEGKGGASGGRHTTSAAVGTDPPTHLLGRMACFHKWFPRVPRGGGYQAVYRHRGG